MAKLTHYQSRFGLALTILLFATCTKEATTPPFELQKPAHFPAVVSPEGNELTAERVALGKKLFYEKKLSLDETISCQSCHFQHLAFTDGKPKSVGVGDSVGVRNAPALQNLAYHKFYFRDGGVTSLEGQAMSPIHNGAEMAFNVHKAAERLAKNEQYQQLSQAAYDREMSAYVIVRALAAFERTLISGASRFDAYFYEQQPQALNASEIRGMMLFFGRANCSNCHGGFNFTNFDFENNGLYTNYADRGRIRTSLRPEDEAKFAVPSLRNVEHTAPYMHNGSLNTLAEVLEHYNAGGKGHYNQSPIIKPLNLSQRDKTDLINFLKSLTDKAFLENKAFF